VETEVSTDDKENGKVEIEPKRDLHETNRKSSNMSTKNSGKRKRDALSETTDKDNIKKDADESEQKMGRRSKRAKVDQEN